jgi:hypothetical protein
MKNGIAGMPPGVGGNPAILSVLSGFQRISTILEKFMRKKCMF